MIFSGLRLPFARTNQRVTLVMESTVLRVMVAEGETVVRWATEPLAPGLLREGVVADPAGLGQALAEFFQRGGFPRGPLVSCLSAGHMLYRRFTLPALKAADLESAVRYQARRELPLPLEEMTIAWQVVRSTEQQHEVFVVGVPRDVMAGYLDAFKRAGIRPAALDIKPLALARTLDRGTAIVANVEADSLDMIYVHQWVPEFMRTAYFGEWTQASGAPVAQIVAELQRSIKFYNDTNRGSPVSPATPLYLTGGGDYFSLAEALYSVIDHPIQRLDSPLRHPPEFPVDEFATNLGLALKAL